MDLTSVAGALLNFMKVAPLFHALPGRKESARSRRSGTVPPPSGSRSPAEARYVLSSEENPFHGGERTDDRTDGTSGRPDFGHLRTSGDVSDIH